jgi:UDP-N-acetylmuramate dehydrogenase
MVKPRSVAGVSHLLRLVRKLEVPFFVLGGGSNVLVGDDPLDGVVIQLIRACSEIRVLGTVGGRGVEVYAGGGTRLSRLLRFCLESGLSGIEGLVGIPGTIGGAAVMNAGTREGCLADVLLWLDVLDGNAVRQRVEIKELKPEYRCMGLPRDWTVVGAGLSLHQVSGTSEIRHRLRADVKRRKATQPLAWPSAGSVYKNPPDAPAGLLIEKVGLKGFSVGGASISEKHANWIINLGGATAADVRAVMDHIEKSVLEEFGVCLQREILIL